MATRKWTPEQRSAQSAAIRTWQPWQHSTGARTTHGKAIYQETPTGAVHGLLCGLLAWYIESLAIWTQ